MKNKIAFYLPNLDNGGAPRVVLNLLKGLEGQNFEVYLFLGVMRGEYKQQIPQYVKIVNLNVQHQIFAVLRLVKHIRSINPQIFISNGLGCNINILLAKKIFRIQSKIVTIEHNKIDMFLEERKKYSYIRKRIFDFRYLLAKYLYPRYIDIIVAVSGFVADDLQKYYSVPKSQIRVIKNPIVLSDIKMKISEQIEHSWFRNKTMPIILAVGRLAFEKRFDILIEAFYKVNKEKECRLVILGEGPERENLKKLITDLQLKNSVDLLGYEDNPYKFMNQSNIVVLSSMTEGLPMVLLEAMACHCNVIATRCNGPEEILCDDLDQYLVPVDDVDLLAIKIKSVLDENFNKRFLERAKEFDINIILNQYIKVFNFLITKSRRDFD